MTLEEFEQIETYLDNTMKLEDRLQFEESLKNDPVLRGNLDDIKLQISAIEEVSFREKLNQMHDQIEIKETILDAPVDDNDKVVTIRWRKYAIAASVAILLGAGFYFSSRKPAHEKLYAEYFSPDPGLVTPMSATENYELFRGMVDYKQGNYKLAIDRWREQLKIKPTNDTLLFYLGVSNLALENNKSGRLYLKQMPKDGSSAFSSESNYYLGLSELKDGNLELAKKYLQKSDFSKSKEILNKLN